MDEFLKFCIGQWPYLSSMVGLIFLIVCGLGIPIAAIWWAIKFINKDRYIFAQKDHLYCLDTVTGKIRVARGYFFQEVSNCEARKTEKKRN